MGALFLVGSRLRGPAILLVIGFLVAANGQGGSAPSTNPQLEGGEAPQHSEAAAMAPDPGQSDWITLFDGTDLSEWRIEGREEYWRITEAGELSSLREGRNLYTKERFCDFELELEFRPGLKSNSGLFIRMHHLDDEFRSGMEVQILDNAGFEAPWQRKDVNSALYEMAAPAVDASRQTDEWNRLMVRVDGHNVQIVLNDEQTVSVDLSLWTEPRKNPDGSRNKCPYPIAQLPKEGFVGLQNYRGGGTVCFRNIRIRPLSDRKPRFTGEEPIKEVLLR